MIKDPTDARKAEMVRAAEQAAGRAVAGIPSRIGADVLVKVLATCMAIAARGQCPAALLHEVKGQLDAAFVKEMQRIKLVDEGRRRRMN